MVTPTLEEVIREAFGRLVYTHKSHEKQADIILGNYRCLVWIDVALIALTSGGSISVVFDVFPWGKAATAIISLLALGLTIYQLRAQPEQKAQQHRTTASKLWSIREEYIHLLCDLRDGKLNDQVVRTTRDELTKKTAEIYGVAPSLCAKAYANAQQGLQKEEEMTFSDEEINAFLPRSLHRG